MEMAQRTREIISKLGGFKQMPEQSEGSSSFTDSPVQPAAVFSRPEARSSETTTVTAKPPVAADSKAISKIRQNTSLVQYAFNLPVESENRNESGSSLPSRDLNSSRTDAEHKYGGTFETPIPHQSREAASYAVTSVPATASYKDNSAVYSQQSSWNTAPQAAQEPAKAAQEPAKADSCDPTIANILKSIGFNFELSNMMQDKARKDSTSSVGQNRAEQIPAEPLPQANKVPSFYEERANRYRAEQMMQYGTHKLNNEESLQLHGAFDSTADKTSLNLLQHSYDEKPFAAEDIFKESPAVDFKLKFKASDANAGQKSGTLYENFSDSDDDFTATAKEPKIENISNQNAPNMSTFGNEGMWQQTATNKTADDIDWELSTEEFIRKLQQPREAQRTVTVVPKSEPAVLNERVDSDAVEIQSDNLKLAKSFVPLEELKTIRKTIIVSGSPVKTESGVGKSDSSSKGMKNTHSADSTSREKTPKFHQRSESLSKSTEKAGIDNSHRRKRGSDADERDSMPTSDSKVTKTDSKSPSASKERQKRMDALEKELEKLRRQQSILMRRRKREKDAHKDPILMENSKLQEEICVQLEKLRAAREQSPDNSRSQTPDQVYDAVSLAFKWLYDSYYVLKPMCDSI